MRVTDRRSAEYLAAEALFREQPQPDDREAAQALRRQNAAKMRAAGVYGSRSALGVPPALLRWAA